MALLEHQETSILLGAQNGFSPSEIARELGVHRATVGRFLKRHKNPLKTTKKCGRAEQSACFRIGARELDAPDQLNTEGVAVN